MTIELKKRVCAPIMLAAFEAGSLCKQRFPRRGARYRQHDGAPCVVGACVSDEEAELMDKGVGSYSGVGKLEMAGVVKLDDAKFFMNAQEFHDNENWPALEKLLRDACAESANAPA
jgi:hypothetical protein